MTEMILMLSMILWPLGLMKLGTVVSRVLRDRRIDAEIEANMWRA